MTAPYVELAALADREVKRKAERNAPGRDVDPKDAIERARLLLAPQRADVPGYPTEALGPLAEACRAIVAEGQLQPAMAGQCLLATASLLTQGLFNVRTLAGVKPLSLYMMTLGDSGDGKSTAEVVALHPVREWQREAGKRYAAALQLFEQERTKQKKGDAAPVEPANPYRLSRDATVEGLRRDLDAGPCSQGMYTSEAAAVLCGYGLSAEHRAKTAAVFNGLWDDGYLSVSRATGGRVERSGRRLALHWLIQPSAAAGVLGDPMLSSIGMWPRFLLAWPQTSEPRVAKPFRPENSPAIGHYWQRCSDLLAKELPDDASANNPILELDADATEIVNRAFERFEVEARRGKLRSVKPFALRATEQVCRVAGVLAAFSGRLSVSHDDAVGALQLVSYALDSWRGVFDDGAADPLNAKALKLYAWLMSQPGQRAALPYILRHGPGTTRSAGARDDSLSLLSAHSLASTLDGEVFGHHAGEAP